MCYNEYIPKKGDDGMYLEGQKVVYGIHGVCMVIQIETKIIDRKKIPYYVLEPLDQPGARFYVPIEKPAAVAKISPLMSSQDIQALLSSELPCQAVWVAEENQRKMRFRELIGNGDRKVLAAIVKALYAHKKEQMEKGKKFHLCDENFLRDSEKLLCSEIAAACGISNEEALNQVRTALQ